MACTSSDSARFCLSASDALAKAGTASSAPAAWRLTASIVARSVGEDTPFAVSQAVIHQTV